MLFRSLPVFGTVAEVVITLLLRVSNGPNSNSTPLRGSGLGISLAKLILESLHLGEAADVALFVGEFGTHVRAHKLFGKFFAGDARAKDEDIDVVVLDALMGGVGVRAHSGTDAAEFVGGDGSANAAATDENAAFGPAVEHGLADGFGEIGIVGRIFVVGADV